MKDVKDAVIRNIKDVLFAFSLLVIAISGITAFVINIRSVQTICAIIIMLSFITCEACLDGRHK